MYFVHHVIQYAIVHANFALTHQIDFKKSELNNNTGKLETYLTFFSEKVHKNGSLNQIKIKKYWELRLLWIRLA